MWYIGKIEATFNHVLKEMRDYNDTVSYEFIFIAKY